jgi:hypothetical protein
MRSQDFASNGFHKRTYDESIEIVRRKAIGVNL